MAKSEASVRRANAASGLRKVVVAASGTGSLLQRKTPSASRVQRISIFFKRSLMLRRMKFSRLGEEVDDAKHVPQKR